MPVRLSHGNRRLCTVKNNFSNVLTGKVCKAKQQSLEAKGLPKSYGTFKRHAGRRDEQEWLGRGVIPACVSSVPRAEIKQRRGSGQVQPI